MRWFWQRRKAPPERPDVRGGVATLPRGKGARARRGDEAGEPRDAALAFARGYLLARGARVRVEGDDLLSATLPDGEAARYTTALARADAETSLLVPGGDALSSMLEDTATRARVCALHLQPSQDAAALVRAVVAEPAPGCGRCVVAEDGAPTNGAIAPCEGCPLRAGRIVLAGAGPARDATVIRQWEAAAVELTYLVSGRDRAGRTEEVVRVALDTEPGRTCEPLTLEQAAGARPGTPPDDAATLAATAVERAEGELRPVLDAAGVFLRRRAAEGYRARVADLTNTHERLRREYPERAREIAASLKRELAALAEVHAVEARASLESICFVTTSMAEVRVRLGHGPEVALTVDVGRGAALPPACAGCGAPTRSGAVCTVGHVTCPACGPACPACATVAAAASGKRVSSKRPTARPPARKAGDALTVAHLAALTPELWRACVSWLLEGEGHRVERTPEGEDADVWHVADGERVGVALGLRPPGGRLLAGGDVRRAAALAAGMPGGRAMLVSPAEASDEARAAAGELGVVLWDGVALRERLAWLTTAHSTEEARAQGEAKERAAAASRARAQMVKSLDQAASALEAPAAGGRVAGRAALDAAVADLRAVRQSAERAFLAWETLVADWLAAFAERPTRANELAIAADATRLRELRERAVHLGKALQGALSRLAKTPADGEMGYGAWRQALAEEYAARCASLRARIEAVDPAAWEDFDRARSTEARQRAERAARDAAYAAARAGKAYAQLAELVGAS